MTKETGGPAFPQDYAHTKVLVDMQRVGDITVNQLSDWSKQLAGMTLRDYFAAKALSGLLAHPASDAHSDKEIAQQAFNMADAMLKARGL